MSVGKRLLTAPPSRVGMRVTDALCEGTGAANNRDQSIRPQSNCLARMKPGWRRRSILVLIFFWLTAYGPMTAAQAQSCSQSMRSVPLHWQVERLDAAKTAISEDRFSHRKAYATLIARADDALAGPLHTVTDKTIVPPGGDRRDYRSLAPYWWPDPTKKDGLPYIRKDGERNPASDGDDFDKRRSVDMVDAVEALALAAYLTGNEAYAEKVRALLDAWFINEATRMNPHLKFGQAIPGINEGRGIGIIDTRIFVRVVDASLLLRHTGMLNDETLSALQNWFGAYAAWLIQSPLGKDERAATNNHGVFYDMQLATFLIFADRCDLAEKVVSDSKARIDAQIDPDGLTPLEKDRTRSFHYHAFNAEAFLGLARLADHFGIDLLTYEQNDGGSIADAVMALADYAGREADWPYPALKVEAGSLWSMLMWASLSLDAPDIANALRRSGGADDTNVLHILTYRVDGNERPTGRKTTEN